jgi:mannose-6-phosphate isomerase-like protein (cupin superfamily)
MKNERKWGSASALQRRISMRALFLACVTAFTVLAARFAAQEAPVKYFPASDMAALFTKGGTVTTGPNYRIMASQRTGTGEAELHELDTDIFRIMSGSATFVTGGTIVGGHATDPGETRGSGIEGGETRRIAAGDVIVIEKGTPHWFKAVDGRVEYFVVKVR